MAYCFDEVGSTLFIARDFVGNCDDMEKNQVHPGVSRKLYAFGLVWYWYSGGWWRVQADPFVPMPVLDIEFIGLDTDF